MASNSRLLETEPEYNRLLMLGKTGSGKSTTGNTILGQKLFKYGASSSVTTACAMKDAVVEGTKVEILDCPGLCDTSQTDADIAVVITKAVVGLHPGPHAVLYVLSTERFTAEDYEAFKKLERLFDKRLFDYMIVVITGGDNFEYDGISPKDAIESAPPSMTELLRDCGQRYIIFNNRAKNPGPQVQQLLTMVRERILANGDNPHYRCPTYDGIGAELEKEVRSRIEGVEKEMLQKQQAFQNHIAQQKKEAEEKLKEQKEKYEKQIADKEISQADAKKKLKQMQDDHNAKLAKKDQDLQAMKDQHTRDLTNKALEVERRTKQETVGGKGILARVKDGVKRVVGGVVDVVTAPVRGIADLFA